MAVQRGAVQARVGDDRQACAREHEPGPAEQRPGGETSGQAESLPARSPPADQNECPVVGALDERDRALRPDSERHDARPGGHRADRRRAPAIPRGAGRDDHIRPSHVRNGRDTLRIERKDPVVDPACHELGARVTGGDERDGEGEAQGQRYRCRPDQASIGSTPGGGGRRREPAHRRNRTVLPARISARRPRSASSPLARGVWHSFALAPRECLA